MVQEWNLFHISSAASHLARTQWHGPIHLEGRLKCGPNGSPGRSRHCPVGKVAGRVVGAPALRVRTPGSFHHGSPETNLTSILEDMGSTPDLAQWVKDPALL